LSTTKRNFLSFYFQQETIIDGRVSSQALIRAGIKSKAGIVPVKDVLRLFGQESLNMTLPDWVEAWIGAEEQRPKI